jgi:hypothetical protein
MFCPLCPKGDRPLDSPGVPGRDEDEIIRPYPQLEPPSPIIATICCMEDWLFDESFS